MRKRGLPETSIAFVRGRAAVEVEPGLAPNEAVDAGPNLPEEPEAGQRDDSAVECEIEVHDRTVVAPVEGPDHRVDQGVELGDVGGRHRSRGSSEGSRFQHGSDVVDRADLVVGYPDDDCPTVGEKLDQPLLLQLTDRFSNGAAAHTQSLGDPAATVRSGCEREGCRERRGEAPAGEQARKPDGLTPPAPPGRPLPRDYRTGFCCESRVVAALSAIRGWCTSATGRLPRSQADGRPTVPSARNPARRRGGRLPDHRVAPPA